MLSNPLPQRCCTQLQPGAEHTDNQHPGPERGQSPFRAHGSVLTIMVWDDLLYDQFITAGKCLLRIVHLRPEIHPNSEKNWGYRSQLRVQAARSEAVAAHGRR